MRVISTGRALPDGRKEYQNGSLEGEQDVVEEEHDEDMMDVETPTSTPTTRAVSSPSTLDRDSEELFTATEWQTVALGWRDFQNDLRFAAQSGVQVWRMKVCVLTTRP